MDKTYNIGHVVSADASKDHTHYLKDLKSDEDYNCVSEDEIEDWNSKATGDHSHKLEDLEDSEDYRTVTDDEIKEWNSKAPSSHSHHLADLQDDEDHRTITDEAIDKYDKYDDRLYDLEHSEALPAVDTYDDLPDAADYKDKHYLVNTTTGIIGFRKLSGIYISDGDNWTRMSKNQLKAFDSDMLDGEDSDYYLDRANHSGTQSIDTINELQDNLDDLKDNKSDTSHTHDDRYYTETEIDDKLDNKSDTSHTHDLENINNLNATYTQTFSDNVDIDNGDAKVIKLFDEVTIKKSRKIRIDYYIPYKFNTSIRSDEFCGIYFNLNIKINDNWYNLGNNGINESYINDDATNSQTYNNFMILDFVNELDIRADYTVQVEITARTTEGSANINSDHDINSTDNNLDSRGDLYKFSNQQYAHISIQELNL